ncbi:membrane hypothetical protein [uncultured Desulfobacterium sp.]|uniref:Mechanosensitive ion channel inner membrane domain-containing protein n=1 Tax=uncultured Desulfobacterium sp. TaxID=201089 RepID=A0A445MYQ4_9BACT|nr:membrane hypothetical protein [uncultured Desulfobacterium sp.]
MKQFLGKISSLRMKCRPLSVLILLFFVLTGLRTVHSEETNQSSTATAPPTVVTPAPAGKAAAIQSWPEVIPVEDVAARAAEASSLVRTLTEEAHQGSQIHIIRKSFSEVTAEAERKLAETMRILHQEPALPTLQTQQQHWRQMQNTYSGFLESLTKRSKDLQENLKRLDDLQKIWAATLKNAEDLKSPAVSLQQINETLQTIHSAQNSLKERLTQILESQSAIGVMIDKCETMLAQITRMEQAAVSAILVHEPTPVWSPTLWSDALNTLPMHLQKISDLLKDDIKSYFTAGSWHLFLHVCIFAVIYILFLVARYNVRRWTTAGESFSSVIRVFDNPIAGALAVTLFIATSPYWLLLPVTIRAMFQTVMIWPMIILVQPFVSKPLVRGLYVIGLLFAADMIREIFLYEHLGWRVFLILESLTGLVAAKWFQRIFRPVVAETSGLSSQRIVLSVLGFASLLLVCGFLTALVGYVRFSRLITPGVIACAAMAISIYAFLHIILGFITISFNVFPLRTLRMIQRHRAVLEKQIYRFLIWLAVVILISRYLGYTGLIKPVMEMGKTFLHIE